MTPERQNAWRIVQAMSDAERTDLLVDLIECLSTMQADLRRLTQQSLCCLRSGATRKEPTMIQEATYRGKAVDAIMGLTETGAHPFVGVMYEVTMGDERGQRVPFRGYLHEEKSAERTIESLRHSGWKGSSFPVNARGIGAWPGLGSEEVQIVVQHEPAHDGSGKVYPRVAFVNRLFDLRVKNPLPAEQTQRLSQRWDGLLKKHAPSSNGAVRAASTPTPAPHELPRFESSAHDEIPF